MAIPGSNFQSISGQLYSFLVTVVPQKPSKLKYSNDGFSVVADYFGRGVFNKLTLITDAPTEKSRITKDVGLQRDLLMNTRRNV